MDGHDNCAHQGGKVAVCTLCKIVTAAALGKVRSLSQIGYCVLTNGGTLSGDCFASRHLVQQAFADCAGHDIALHRVRCNSAARLPWLSPPVLLLRSLPPVCHHQVHSTLGSESAPAVGPVCDSIGFWEVFLRTTRRVSCRDVRSIMLSFPVDHVHARVNMPCSTALAATYLQYFQLQQFQLITATHCLVGPLHRLVSEGGLHPAAAHLALGGIERLALPHEAPALALLALQLHLRALILRPVTSLRLSGQHGASFKACANSQLAEGQ